MDDTSGDVEDTNDNQLTGEGRTDGYDPSAIRMLRYRPLVNRSVFAEADDPAAMMRLRKEFLNDDRAIGTGMILDTSLSYDGGGTSDLVGSLAAPPEGGWDQEPGSGGGGYHETGEGGHVVGPEDGGEGNEGGEGGEGEHDRKNDRERGLKAMAKRSREEKVKKKFRAPKAESKQEYKQERKVQEHKQERKVQEHKYEKEGKGDEPEAKEHKYSGEEPHDTSDRVASRKKGDEAARGIRDVLRKKGALRAFKDRVSRSNLLEKGREALGKLKANVSKNKAGRVVGMHNKLHKAMVRNTEHVMKQNVTGKRKHEAIGAWKKNAVQSREDRLHRELVKENAVHAKKGVEDVRKREAVRLLKSYAKRPKKMFYGAANQEEGRSRTPTREQVHREAATKIQKHVRGRLARRQVAKEKVRRRDAEGIPLRRGLGPIHFVRRPHEEEREGVRENIYANQREGPAGMKRIRSQMYDMAHAAGSAVKKGATVAGRLGVRGAKAVGRLGVRGVAALGRAGDTFGSKVEGGLKRASEAASYGVDRRGLASASRLGEQRNVLQEQLKKDVVSLAKGGAHTAAEIGKMIGKSAWWVSSVLTRAGIDAAKAAYGVAKKGVRKWGEQERKHDALGRFVRPGVEYQSIHMRQQDEEDREEKKRMIRHRKGVDKKIAIDSYLERGLDVKAPSYTRRTRSGQEYRKPKGTGRRRYGHRPLR